MKISALLLVIWLSCMPATVIASESEISRIKCAELGRTFSSEFKREYVSDISIWGNPEFHYNNVLGTCLVYTEVVDGALHKDIHSVWYNLRITDIYSNKVIAYSRYFIDKNDHTRKVTRVNLTNVGDVVNLSPDHFMMVKSELFGQ